MARLITIKRGVLRIDMGLRSTWTTAGWQFYINRRIARDNHEVERSAEEFKRKILRLLSFVKA